MTTVNTDFIKIDPSLIKWLDEIFPDSLSRVVQADSERKLGVLLGERKVVEKIKQLKKQQEQSGALHVS